MLLQHSLRQAQHTRPPEGHLCSSLLAGMGPAALQASRWLRAAVRNCSHDSGQWADDADLSVNQVCAAVVCKFVEVPRDSVCHVPQCA